MSGHSKWANIRHKKDRADAKRGKIFTTVIKEITVAAKLGGPDAGSNPRLRLALDKAASVNMPKDNIKRAIDRGAGGGDEANYSELRYEGYGVAGAAVMVDCLTDNKIRTVADVRHAFTKHGGNLGTDGSVSFLFKHEGYLVVEPGVDEDALMEAAMEAGAADIVTNDDGSVEVTCDPYEFPDVKEKIVAAGFTPVDSDATFRPTTEVQLEGEDAAKMQRLIDALEELDDVQDVYTTAVFDYADED